MGKKRAYNMKSLLETFLFKRLRERSIMGMVLFLLILYLLPIVVHEAYYIDVLIKSTMYMTLALSLSLIIGHLGMLALTHPAFFGIGAYASALLCANLGVPVLLSMFLAGIITGIIALAIAFPLMRLSYHSFAIGTLAFLVISRILALRWVSLTRGAMGIPGLLRPDMFASDKSQYYLILIIATLTLICIYLLVNSRFGRALNAIRENETLAESVGVNPYKYKIQAFAISAIFAGFAGAFLAHYLSIIHPKIIDFWHNIYLLVILLVISPTSLSGVVFSSYLFTFLPEALRVAKEIRFMLYGLILMTLIVYIHKTRGLGSAITKLLASGRGETQ